MWPRREVSRVSDLGMLQRHAIGGGEGHECSTTDDQDGQCSVKSDAGGEGKAHCSSKTQEGEGGATMRLNYTMADEQTLDRAVKTLAEVIGQVGRNADNLGTKSE